MPASSPNSCRLCSATGIDPASACAPRFISATRPDDGVCDGCAAPPTLVGSAAVTSAVVDVGEASEAGSDRGVLGVLEAMVCIKWRVSRGSTVRQAMRPGAWFAVHWPLVYEGRPMETLNMKTVFIALVVGASALSAAGCAVTSGQSTVGQAVDDGTISTRVKARMAEDPAVSAMRIEVETLNGVVQLAGFATSAAEKERAGTLARGVPNVREVRNNIIVRAPN
jgi:hyperosmotically inducible periplasmic protein